MHNEKLFHIILHTKGISFKDCPKILNTAMSKTVDTRTTLCYKPAETRVFFLGGGGWIQIRNLESKNEWIHQIKSECCDFKRYQLRRRSCSL